MGKLYEITNAEYLDTSKGLCIMCDKNYIPPRSQKYCSAECSQIAVKKARGTFVNEQKTCVCVRCEKEFQYQKHKSSVYCSTECQSQTAYEKNRSAFSIKSITKGLRDDGHKTTSEWMQGGVLLPQPLLDALEFAPSNIVWEDTHIIDKIIAEELPQARYQDGSFVTNTLYKGWEYYYGKRKESVASDEDQSTEDTFTED